MTIRFFRPSANWQIWFSTRFLRSAAAVFSDLCPASQMDNFIPVGQALESGVTVGLQTTIEVLEHRGGILAAPSRFVAKDSL